MSRRNAHLNPPEKPTAEQAPEAPQLPAHRPEPPTALARAGHAANHAAQATLFTRYQRRLADNTLAQQHDTLGRWATYLATAGLPPTEPEWWFSSPEAWQDVTWGLVQGFQEWLFQGGYAIATINARLSTIRTYCRLAHQAGVLESDEWSRIQQVRAFRHKERHRVDKRRKTERVGHKKAKWVELTLQQAIQLKRQPTDSPQGRRDRLLMCLLLDHGLRVGEVAALKAEHFDMARRTMTFWREKVSLEQSHRLTPDTLAAAQAYLTLDVPTGPLLRGSRKDGSLMSSGMTAISMSRRVRVLGKELGITGLSAHDCRHFWATNAIRSGTQIDALQHAGGWASPAMPLRYASRDAIANERVVLRGTEEPDKP